MQQSFTSKARAFVAIDSLEQDLRQCIMQFLLDHMEPEEVFGSDLAELRHRRDSDTDGGEGLVTDYLYLRQGYDILLRHSAILPHDLGELLSKNVGAMDVFVGVRNRVMHGRPLRPDDLDNAHSFVARFRSRYFPATDTVLDNLEQDPSWQPAITAITGPVDRVLHNLPAADFDETGLVGRSNEARNLIDLLIRGRDRMITLTGEGGIGKTALALDACYAMVDEVDPPFEAVLWVSLKNERLTADGVRIISDAVRDVSGAVHELGRSLDSSFSGRLDELADYLSGLRALIVIDNLESAQGSEVVALYDSLPESVTFLFTSRVGIGQIERRVTLGGLIDRDAVLLLRKFAARRGQRSLAGLRNDVALDVVRNLRYSPLAIRWYVLSVEAGQTPTDTLRNQTELLRFCVENVYTALSIEARLMLGILRTLDRPISFDELAIVASVDIDTLRRGTQALSQGSLVVRTPSSERGAPDLLALSATARAYLPRADLDSEVMAGVLEREAVFLRDRQEARLTAAKRTLDPNVVMARSPEDEPTAHLLRLALRLSKAGEHDSESYIERARTLNPGYYEVDRVEAFIASHRGNSSLAVARYKDALAQSENDEERASVSFFLAGHLARVGHDLGGALPHAEFSHKVLTNADTASALGNFYIWDKRFSEGLELLSLALQMTDSSKLKRIITTASVDGWRRWAEDELDEKMPQSAVEKGLTGVRLGKVLLQEGTHDYRLVESVARALLVALRALRALSDADENDLDSIRRELKFVSRDGRFRFAEAWDRIPALLSQLPTTYKLAPDNFLAHETSPQGAGPSDSTDASAADLPSQDAALPTHTGVIINRRETFAFISHPDFPGNVFFHVGSLSRAEDWEHLRTGSTVEFVYSKDTEGRDRAKHVVLVPSFTSS